MKENMEPETIEDVFTLIDIFFAFRAIDEIEERLRNQPLVSLKELLIWISIPFLIVGFFMLLQTGV